MSGIEVVPALRPAPEVHALLNSDQVRRYQAVPLRRDRETLVVVMSNPGNLALIQEIEFLTSSRVQAVAGSPLAIRRAIEEHYDTSPSRVATATLADDIGSESPVVALQRILFREAVRSGASDIHIDPCRRSSEVRYRVNGAMADGFRIPRWLHERLVARIKVIAGLDVSERRLPQDGHLTDDGGSFEARVSTLPGYSGEAVVLRLFPDHSGLPSLSALGGDARVRERLLAMSYRSQGVLLVTGPTGSGKTTTLYAMINELRRRPLNIVTIEDPVEYRVDGLRQVQVDERRALTFASALRSTLRQDPDVILVGEIRDAETARIAFHAGLTGHLVLSTVHATEAVTALVRLGELGVDRAVIASTLIGVVAQRLLRLNCHHCLVPESPLPRLAAHMGIPAEACLRFRRSRGCGRCRFSGIGGRSPLFEILEPGGAVARCLTARQDAELRRVAMDSGFVPLVAQARDCVLSGEVSFEEAYRTCYFGEPA